MRQGLKRKGLEPVIPVTQDYFTEAGGLQIQGQPGQFISNLKRAIVLIKQ